MIPILVILAISALLAVVLLYKQILNKTKINFLQTSIQELSIKHQEAINEKIEIIKDKEHLLARIEKQEK